MNEYLKQYIELQKQFRETEGDPDSVRALYTFKEKLELSEDKQAKEVLVDVYDLLDFKKDAYELLCQIGNRSDKKTLKRLGILKEHGLGLKEIQDTIAKIDPLPGAKAFLDELRATTQVIILSDTFEEFAKPLMEKLGWPTIFCNSLEVAENGEITGYKMRCEKSKLTTVKALQSIGYDTIASGDSFNDLGMIQASKAGFLFKSTEQIKADHPEIPAFEEFDDLLAAIKAAL